MGTKVLVVAVAKTVLLNCGRKITLTNGENPSQVCNSCESKDLCGGKPPHIAKTYSQRPKKH